MVSSWGGGAAMSGGGGGGAGIAAITELAEGVTDTVTISGGGVDVIITGAGGGGGGRGGRGGGRASLACAGVEVASSGGDGGVGAGGALVLPSSPARPCTMLLMPLIPSQIRPSRFSQKRGRSVMLSVKLGGRMSVPWGYVLVKSVARTETVAY